VGETAGEGVLRTAELVVRGSVGITGAALARAGIADEVTLMQWRVMLAASSAEPVRIGEIARRVRVSPTAATRLVHRLERRGIVSSETDPDDRRAANVSLTPRGRRLAATIETARRELLQMALADCVPRWSSSEERALEDVANALAEFR
jgi:DNA-binding MarR family transcriptional regulator